MNINPYYIADHGLTLIKGYKTQIDKVIAGFETNKTLNCLHGIRPTVSSSMYPCFEIELQGQDTEWGTTRGQRHNLSFRCLVSITCPKLDFREEYLLTLTSAVVSILQDPKHLQFRVVCANPVGRGYELSVYDSLVRNVSYTNREGTIAVGEFTWNVMVHERIADVNFSCVPDQAPAILTPIVKEVRESD